MNIASAPRREPVMSDLAQSSQPRLALPVGWLSGSRQEGIVPVDFLRLAGAAFLELPAHGVIVTDNHHRIAYWSKGAERLLEIYSDQAMNRQVEQVIQFADSKSGDELCLGDSPAAWESRQAIRRGKPLLVESICMPLKDDQQNTVGFLFVMQDKGESGRDQRARLQAEEANRAKDRFIAMAAHELRTPINAILGWTQMFHRGIISDTEIPMTFATIENNARSLSRLTEDLLDISRMAAGKFRLEVRRVELFMVIDKAIQSLRPAAAGKHIEIKMALDTSLGTVAGDPHRLQQIVFNLLSNAIKFTPDKGCVEVKVERLDSKAQITVSDTGPGISEEFLPHIFDPFSQADVTNGERREGLGLGLTIVRHIVDLHNGTIHVNSNKGHGTSFIVELPLWRDLLVARDEICVSHFTDRSGLPLAGLRVLVVDDSDDLLELFEEALTLYGAAVELTKTAAEAIEVIRRWKPDVLVSDIELQGEDGYALIARVRDMAAEQGGSTPSIAITGYAEPEDQERALAAGYQMFIAKPVELSELEAAIALLAGRARR